MLADDAKRSDDSSTAAATPAYDDAANANAEDADAAAAAATTTAAATATGQRRLRWAKPIG